jgi:hypothetical protein
LLRVRPAARDGFGSRVVDRSGNGGLGAWFTLGWVCVWKEVKMVRMFVRHSVSDFGKWKQVYDDFDEQRKGMGVVGQAVFKSIDDPGDVTVWHDFETAEAAREFAGSEALHTAMRDSGVTGEPVVWFAMQD